MKIRATIISVIMLLVHAASASAAEAPGTCISDQEANLMQQVNNYRAENGLPAVAWSSSLSTVAQWHVLDVVTNFATVFAPGCNLHSWSNWKPSIWNAMCYTDNHAKASLMWSKPREITNNVYRGNGFELGGHNYINVAAVLNGWKNSPGHNDVLLNKGAWTNVNFKAMGAGIDPVTRFYYLWFGTDVDPNGEMPQCSPPLFDSGFE